MRTKPTGDGEVESGEPIVEDCPIATAAFLVGCLTMPDRPLIMDGVAGTANVVGNDELLLLDDGNCDVRDIVDDTVPVSRRLGIVSVCNDNTRNCEFY